MNGDDDSKIISMDDSPQGMFPLYFNGNRNLPLAAGIEVDTFSIYLAARTLDSQPTFLPWGMFGLLPQGTSKYLYYSEAKSNWQLVFTVLNGVGRVTGSKSAWSHQQIPFMPEVNIVDASVGVNPPFLTLE